MTTGEALPASAPEADPGPLKALCLSVVCPGLGEMRTGHRKLGWAILGVFVVAAVWFLVAATFTVPIVMDQLRVRIPEMTQSPADAALAADRAAKVISRLREEVPWMLREIHTRLGAPAWIMFILFFVSVVQAPILASRARRCRGPARSAE